MYAVFKLGGNQHRATVGDIVKVQKLDGDVGATVEVTDVLMVRTDKKAIVGTPTVAGAKIIGEIVDQGRDKKVTVVKFKRRKDYRRKQGHRQYFTTVKITEVVIP